MWAINRSYEIASWIENLDDDAKEAILKGLFILQEMGPLSGRPYIDSIEGNRYSNMKGADTK